jgi:pilus assembly protein CpaB
MALLRVNWCLMRTGRPILILALSLLFGILAVVFAANWSQGSRQGSTTKVVVAAKDIPLGSSIASSALKVVEWPQANALPGSFQDTKALEGRVAKTTVVAGEPIIEAKLAPRGASGGLAASISSGRRAITVKVNEVVGVAGFALPGNFVDVLVNVKELDDKPVSKIVLERILVLAIAQEASRDDNKPKVVNAVTLEVTPEQAERLDLARNIGTLSLVLRNQVDTEALATKGVRPTELLTLSQLRSGADQRHATETSAAGKKGGSSEGRKRAKGSAPRGTRHAELIRGIERTEIAY